MLFIRLKEILTFFKQMYLYYKEYRTEFVGLLSADTGIHLRNNFEIRNGKNYECCFESEREEGTANS